jgi:hypothetical protein
MRRFGQSSYSYSPFWEYQQRTLKARLSAALGGFDKDILERFYSLTPDQLVRLFNIYSKEYGDGPRHTPGGLITIATRNRSPELRQQCRSDGPAKERLSDERGV